MAWISPGIVTPQSTTRRYIFQARMYHPIEVHAKITDFIYQLISDLRLW